MRVVDLPARAADTAFRGPVPGNGKTDAKDAFIIVDAARTLSDTLLPIGKACDLVEGLRMLSEFDADLAVDENRLTPAVDAVVGESMGVRTGVTMLVEITDIGRSATLSTAIVSSPLAAIYGAFCGHGFSPRTAR